MRTYSLFDRFIIGVDQAFQTVFGRAPAAGRPNPTNTLEEPELCTGEKDLAVRLMRIDHTGEICAQALYQGQAMTARSRKARQNLEGAALEEGDHLAWCEARIDELGGNISRLNPIFYAGSFTLGTFAGLLGDRWSLGFLAETETQVTRHLEGHLQRLPEQDVKSRAVLEQMKQDEQHHARMAIADGGTRLPGPVKGLMGLASKVMTATTYWI